MDTNFGIISAFPNPTSGKLTIQSEREIKSINIYSITGAKVYSRPKDQTSNEIDLSSYNNGIYVVVVNDGVKNHTLKVIKQ